MTQTLPTCRLGKTGPEVTRIALGCMGMAGTWNPAEVDDAKVEAAVAAYKAALDAGITFYDHADIYGGTACESIFKTCLEAVPGSREKIVIATKCGIRRGFYQLDADYIQSSLEGSLTRMGLDYVDIYQMHRPDPFTHPRGQRFAHRDDIHGNHQAGRAGVFQRQRTGQQRIVRAGAGPGDMRIAVQKLWRRRRHIHRSCTCI